MKHLLLTTIAAVVLVGCGESQPPEPPKAKASDISIHDAAYKGNVETVKQHLAAGADVNAEDQHGWTPLYAAAAGGHKEIVDLLITNSADVNAKYAFRTPLHEAALGGHKEIVELLIAKGANVNVNAKIDWGGTSLHFAAANGHKEIAELLIAKGADVNAKSVLGQYKGKTPLDAANETNHPKTADLLRKHGGKTGEELKAEGK
jgi:cytohesin